MSRKLLEAVAKVENNLHLPPQHVGASAPGKNIFDRMEALKVPNVSVTVIDKGGVAWTREYDLASRSSHESQPTTPAIFQAASVSKTVNAVLAMKVLVETRVMDLDDDVRPHLKGWTIPGDDHGEKITLRRLLSHTAGMSVGGPDGYHAHPGESLPTTTETLAGQLATSQSARLSPNGRPARIEHKPGEKCIYSNDGTLIVQKLIEDVTGRRYADLAKELIFKPLGMELSTFEYKYPETASDNIQKGHCENGDVGWRIIPESGAAGLWTTTEDLAKFAIAMQNAYRGADDTWMSQKTAQAMLTKQHNSRFGLGFELGEGNQLSFGHTGKMPGYRAEFTLFPAQGMGAVVMTNADNVQNTLPLNIEIVTSIAEVYTWPSRENENKKTVESSVKEAAEATLPLQTPPISADAYPITTLLTSRASSGILGTQNAEPVPAPALDQQHDKSPGIKPPGSSN
ncbi:MAG: serine hydrolase domain-containing protein [Coxiellaceae bacterium]|nr:serine hydrolase domain-containing protein [Coxiellaceae bacterium]